MLLLPSRRRTLPPIRTDSGTGGSTRYCRRYRTPAHSKRQWTVSRRFKRLTLPPTHFGNGTSGSTHFWSRYRIRGHENTAAIHPAWERVRSLFRSYFSGAGIEDVVWEKKQSVSCDPVALEKQALGCLSKALACRFGEQSGRRASVELANGWVDRVQNDLHEKLNIFAEHVRLKTGIELGVSACEPIGYDSELDDFRDHVGRLGQRNREAFGKVFQKESG